MNESTKNLIPIHWTFVSLTGAIDLTKTKQEWLRLSGEISNQMEYELVIHNAQIGQFQTGKKQQKLWTVF